MDAVREDMWEAGVEEENDRDREKWSAGMRCGDPE